MRRAVEAHDFGLLLRSWRSALLPPATQAEVAIWLDLSQAQVSRIESGHTRVNDLPKLVKWAMVLGAPAGSLWFDLPSQEIDRLTKSPGDAVSPRSHRGLEPEWGSSGRLTGLSDRRSIGLEDVSVVEAATQAFRQIDNRFGGGRARTAVAAFLQAEISSALNHGRFSRGVRPKFEQASVQIYQLAGWMSYDTGDAMQGRTFLRRALELATSASDDALTAEMLAAMSHQAAFSGRANETIDLALAARRVAHRSGSPALLAESAVLEAQGLALTRDARGCIAALGRAERLFLTATKDNTPDWLSYFDRAYLSAKFAQALRDIDRLGDAERFARDSLQMSEGYDRGRLFNTALLSSILADQGQVEEAVVIARDALGMADQVRSARAQCYLRDIGVRLLPYSRDSSVSALKRDMRASGVDLL